MGNTSTSGWTAHLELEYASRADRAVLSRNRHHGPLVVQRPLYPEEEVCHTCILHPPGGVVGGDQLNITVSVQEHASALLTTPGATKFYRSAGIPAVQKQNLVVENKAVLEWFPQDTILFPGCEAVISTRVDLAAKACFMGWEILCLGLPVNGQRFTEGSLQSSFSLSRSGIPLFLEKLRIEGERDLDRRAGLQGYPVTAMFIATGGTSALLERVRTLVPQEEKALFGVTLMDDLLVARYLGSSTFAVHGLFVDIWKELRPEITGREATLPRIWAT